jgi:hypothetical protein
MVERQPGVQYGQVSNDTGLGWSISAMNGSVDRLYKATGIDRPEALAIVTESVWWVTLVDASIQRSNQAAYNHTLLNLGRGNVHRTAVRPQLAGRSRRPGQLHPA